jgi:hypothetical protein
MGLFLTFCLPPPPRWHADNASGPGLGGAQQFPFAPPGQAPWLEEAANLLKAQLKLKRITYSQLVERLEALGVWEKEANIRNKLNRGKLTAVFTLQCLEAANVDTLRLQG